LQAPDGESIVVWWRVSQIAMMASSNSSLLELFSPLESVGIGEGVEVPSGKGWV